MFELLKNKVHFNGRDIKYQQGYVIPKIKSNFDRYGPENGNYIWPVSEEGLVFNYESRSLPYKQSSMEYHQYEWKVQPTPENIMKALKEHPAVLKNINKFRLDSYQPPLTIEELGIWQSRAAKAFGQSGGAIQQQLPLRVGELIKLGLVKEVE